MCSVKHSQLSPFERTFWGSPLLFHTGHFMNREAVIKLTRPQELWPVRLRGRRARKGHSSRHIWLPLHGPAAGTSLDMISILRTGPGGAPTLSGSRSQLRGHCHHPQSQHRSQEAASTGEAFCFGAPPWGGSQQGSTQGVCAPKACVSPTLPRTSETCSHFSVPLSRGHLIKKDHSPTYFLIHLLFTSHLPRLYGARSEYYTGGCFREWKEIPHTPGSREKAQERQHHRPRRQSCTVETPPQRGPLL